MFFRNSLALSFLITFRSWICRWSWCSQRLFIIAKQTDALANSANAFLHERFSLNDNYWRRYLRELTYFTLRVTTFPIKKELLKLCHVFSIIFHWGSHCFVRCWALWVHFSPSHYSTCVLIIIVSLFAGAGWTLGSFLGNYRRFKIIYR